MSLAAKFCCVLLGLALILSGGSTLLVSANNSDLSLVTKSTRQVQALSGPNPTLLPVPTSTHLDVSPNPALLTNTVTLTATVTASSGTAIPNGNVVFKDGLTILTTTSLNANGVAVFSTTSLALGLHALTAVYQGNTAFLGSTSNLVTEVVIDHPLTGTITTLASSPNPSTFGQSVTFTATVASLGQVVGPTPTGTVTFRDGSTTIGTVTLPANSSTASFTTASLTVGAHSITAEYNGDGTYAISTSLPVVQVVNPATSSITTTTTLTSNPNPALFNQTIVFTASVSPTSGTGTPTGTVNFTDGTTLLKTVALNGSGVATFSTNSLTLGVHLITATYNGNATFAPSTSLVLTQVVINPALNPTATTITSSVNPSIVGQSLTFTATVISSGGANAPTGTVKFLDGLATLGTAQLSPVSGSITTSVATFTTTDLTAGVHLITAEYSGDATYQPSGSLPLTQVVKTMLDCMVVTSSADDYTCGSLREALVLSNIVIVSQSVTITVNVPTISLSDTLPVATNNSSNSLNLLANCNTQSNLGVPGTTLTRANGATFTGPGLSLTNNTNLKGFAIGGFNGYGVVINGNSNTLSCNWLGTTDGTTTNPNSAGGLQIQGSNNVIGQAGQAASGNLFSGNTGVGILVVSGSANTANYNWAGLTKNGTAGLKNGAGAVRVQAGAQLKFGLGNRLQA